MNQNAARVSSDLERGYQALVINELEGDDIAANKNEISSGQVKENHPYRDSDCSLSKDIDLVIKQNSDN